MTSGAGKAIGSAGALLHKLNGISAGLSSKRNASVAREVSKSIFFHEPWSESETPELMCRIFAIHILHIYIISCSSIQFVLHVFEYELAW